MPVTSELLFETIQHVRIANSVTTHERYLRQVCSLEHVGGLLTQVDGILQHLQLWAMGHSILHIQLWGELYYSNIIGLLVLKNHRLVQGQSAQLIEQHTRKYQAVVHLSQGHLGLVHLHVNTQSVATCSHALVNHLMYIAIKLLNEFEIALGQCLFMMERYHLPVGLINLIQRGMTTGIHRVLGHLGGDVGHLIESYDSTTHKYGLGNHNRTSKDVTGIGTESIYDVLALLVQTSCYISHILRHLHLGCWWQRGYQRT